MEGTYVAFNVKFFGGAKGRVGLVFLEGDDEVGVVAVWARAWSPKRTGTRMRACIVECLRRYATLMRLSMEMMCSRRGGLRGLLIRVCVCMCSPVYSCP
jgi:hypothetical protein